MSPGRRCRGVPTSRPKRRRLAGQAFHHGAHGFQGILGRQLERHQVAVEERHIGDVGAESLKPGRCSCAKQGSTPSPSLLATSTPKRETLVVGAHHMQHELGIVDSGPGKASNALALGIRARRPGQPALVALQAVVASCRLSPSQSATGRRRRSCALQLAHHHQDIGQAQARLPGGPGCGRGGRGASRRAKRAMNSGSLSRQARRPPGHRTLWR